ncbi:MAG TPA: O-antigen ligase family protein [Patescibacteria group bacterium]|nr:O-antigen ligase family protein [Patescibacteria group bacterium]
MNSSVFLNNVVIGSWQIYSPILLVLGMIIWYKFSKFAREHLLFIYTLFLMVFIPLYPKIPLEGIRHTFVYIRLDDIAVAIGVALWLFYLLKRKITWKTPLTIPIFAYWGIGLLSTVVAVIFIFPSLANVFPSSAFLYFLRHIEYLIVFFLAFSSMNNKKYLPWLVGVLTISVLLIVGYGFGQARYPQIFLAYSTMNEEFAKGIPLILQSGARIQATFAGHYDLAAYLVMIIPLLASLVFGFKNVFAKLLFVTTSVLALILLLLTASRTSYAVYLVAIIFMLIMQKKKIWIIPVVLVSIMLLLSFHTLAQRFADTLTQQSVVVDARTGKAIGLAQENSSGQVTVIDKTPVGQNLAPGSGYIVSNVGTPQSTTSHITYTRTTLHAGTQSAQITNLNGDFVVRKALAYDDSFTTRFQGEWPRAMNAFLREPLLGSGYSSISLASDNNYLRMLGETGILGFAAFAFIFLVSGIYAYRILPEVDSPAAKSLVLGIMAGIFGLGLNAILIDVFEASKDAYIMWILLGIALGVLTLYQKKKVDLLHDLRILISTPAIITYFLIATFGFFASSLNNFFVADDFTWLKWVGDCAKVVSHGASVCIPAKTTLLHFFTQSGDFFYRPMEKVYFYFMYSLFGFNPMPFHVVSLFLHWLCISLIFVLSVRILKNKVSAFVVSALFLLLSAHTETIYWISASGHLFVALFTLLAILFYDNHRLSGKKYFLFLSLLCILLSPMFHESGVITSLMVAAYAVVMNWSEIRKRPLNILRLLVLFIPLVFYFALRIFAKTPWSMGDYSYNLIKLPLNFFGNLLGYIFVTILGLPFVSVYENICDYGKTHTVAVILVIILLVIMVVGLYRLLRNKMNPHDYQMVTLSILFFLIPLLPFLGFGNLTARYTYLASFAICLFVVYLFQKLFVTFKVKNTYVVGLVIILTTGIFSWYQYQQVLTAGNDWTKAGEITQSFLQDLSDEYQAQGSLPPSPVFYFSNIPQTYGQAWVFPTGLSDAVWMIFQDKNVTVKETPSIALSLQEGESTTSARFYEYQQDGTIVETQRTEVVTPVPAEKNAK